MGNEKEDLKTEMLFFVNRFLNLKTDLKNGIACNLSGKKTKDEMLDCANAIVDIVCDIEND